MENGFKQSSLLFFIYFGITKEEAEKCFGVAIKASAHTAFRDFQRNLKYTKTVKNLEKKDKGEYILAKKNFRDYVEEYLSSQIQTISNLQCLPAICFDCWHRNVCSEIVDVASKYPVNSCEKLFADNSFTYGIAQKWVNMTLKNLLVMGLWDNNKMQHIKKVMHIPVDSYIIEAASQKLGVNIAEHSSDKDLDEKVKTSWTVLNESDYKQFQIDVRCAISAKCDDDTCPIDWEGKVWIEISKEKNNKADTSEKKTTPHN